MAVHVLPGTGGPGTVISLGIAAGALDIVWAGLAIMVLAVTCEFGRKPEATIP